MKRSIGIYTGEDRRNQPRVQCSVPGRTCTADCKSQCNTKREIAPLPVSIQPKNVPVPEAEELVFNRAPGERKPVVAMGTAVTSTVRHASFFLAKTLEYYKEGDNPMITGNMFGTDLPDGTEIEITVRVIPKKEKEEACSS